MTDMTEQRAKEISLTKNKNALVDDNLHGLLSQFNWNASPHKGGKYYAAKHITIKKGIYRICYMHHFVIGKPLKGYMADHINGNTLDNRRTNLRIVTIRKNSENFEVHRKGRPLGIYKVFNKWKANIHIDGKVRHVGSYETAEKATMARKNFLSAYKARTEGK